MNGIFGTNLKHALQKIDMTQHELASRSGITPAAISMLISGDREPSLVTILKICYSLKTTPNDLLSFHSEKQVKMKNEICRLKLKIKRTIELLGERGEDD